MPATNPNGTQLFVGLLLFHIGRFHIQNAIFQILYKYRTNCAHIIVKSKKIMLVSFYTAKVYTLQDFISISSISSISASAISAASAHQQHQRISIISQISASAASGHQQHKKQQRISRHKQHRRINTIRALTH